MNTETLTPRAKGLSARTISMKEKIIRLLLSTEREGMAELIDWLEAEGFFTSPASTKFHGAYQGGLAWHSLRVLELVTFYFRHLDLDTARAVGQKPLPITANNVIIAPLLHDVCKVGAYLGDEAPYRWNKAMPPGHAGLSIVRVTKYIELDPIERMMIRFHMGVYGCAQLYERGSWDYKANAEYNLRSIRKGPKPATKEAKEEDKAMRYGLSLRNAWYHNPICKFMYFADEIAKAEQTTHKIDSERAER